MGGEPLSPDVTVVGGGLAGTAASIHLARAGLRVLCISPESYSEPVGESLDWSAPALLGDLGLPMDRLVSENIATRKRQVTVKLTNGSSRQYIPGAWLARPPFNFEIRTLHLDRRQTDSMLRDTLLREGVQILADRVIAVEKQGRRVTAVKIADGRRISSPWFIDASGSNAYLFPRSFDLPAYAYGPRKVAMWTWFDVPDSVEGTTLYMDDDRSYLDWIWEIPVRANQISVGYVAAGHEIQEKRRAGGSVAQIFTERLCRIRRFANLLTPERPITPNVTSFQCRVHRGVAGPNWMVIGESASMVDPMTSNGVTAALRSAAEASALIIQSRDRSRLPRVATAMYSRRIVDLGRFLNRGIEETIYECPVRNRIGLLRAGRVYTVPAWMMNAAYSRLKPSGVVSTLAFGFVLSLFRAAGVILNAFSRRTATPEAMS